MKIDRLIIEEAYIFLCRLVVSDFPKAQRLGEGGRKGKKEGKEGRKGDSNKGSFTITYEKQLGCIFACSLKCAKRADPVKCNPHKYPESPNVTQPGPHNVKPDAFLRKVIDAIESNASADASHDSENQGDAPKAFTKRCSKLGDESGSWRNVISWISPQYQEHLYTPGAPTRRRKAVKRAREEAEPNRLRTLNMEDTTPSHGGEQATPVVRKLIGQIDLSKD